MTQGTVHYSFNGLASRQIFAVEDLMDKLTEIRDQSAESVKAAAAKFEKGLTLREDGSTDVTSMRKSLSYNIHSGIGDMSLFIEQLRLHQAAVDMFTDLPLDVEALELDSTQDLSEEVIRAVYKHAKEHGKAEMVEKRVPDSLKPKCGL